MKIEQDQLREKVEVLDGSRGRRTRRAAVRIEDLAGLLDLPPAPKSTAPAGATPTAAEYEALRRDVRDLHRSLSAVTAALQARILP